MLNFFGRIKGHDQAEAKSFGRQLAAYNIDGNESRFPILDSNYILLNNSRVIYVVLLVTFKNIRQYFGSLNLE
ncbi:hypothetical protein Lalb_Chr23g0272411 [Lupinus albus]|uniref:Uncharacterized protein n=1 Tax=Lupinus albus TaxID=3870 RepID=A0A6A4NEZ9_LUPAL|nr:hypothetical protein Lalb_Chr23g0272411 [Lupinus albus]